MKINQDFIELCKGIIDESEVYKTDVDWQLMCEMAYKEKILPLFLKKYHTIIPENILLDFGVKSKITNVKNNEIIETISCLQEKIDRVLILGKGCSFSEYIYGDALIRVCKDIDLFVRESDQLYVCRKMETLGFREAHFLNCKRVNKNSLIDFYKSNSEKAFIKEGYPYIEIKTSALLFEKDICSNGIKNHIAFENYPGIKTFDLVNLFVLLNANIFINFFSSWGINAECKIRDIIDLCMFYFKYSSSIKKWDFDQFKLIKYRYVNYTMLDIISANYNLITYFFGEPFTSKFIIPEPINKKDLWPICIDKNQLLFSEQIDRWKWYCKVKSDNPDLFIKYETVILPIRMSFGNVQI